jgi:uncharacterized protein (DUF885 family)
MMYLLLGCLSLWLASSLPAAPAFAGEDARLQAFYQKYLDAYFRQQPMAATMLGDRRFDGQLDDISPSARASWIELARQTLQELPRAVDYQKLTRDGQIDFEIFRHELKKQIWLHENTHPFEEDPRTYGVYLNDSVYLLLAQSTAPKETNIANCLARMAEFPRVIAAAKAALTHPPKPILETAILQNRGAISFYQKDVFLLAGETSQSEPLKAAAAKVVTELQAYQKFLEGDLMTSATGDWRLGKKRFTEKLELELNSGLSADQVLADAEAEFQEVRNSLYVVARQLWPVYFPAKNLPPDDAAGRHETIDRVIDAVNQDHSQPDALVANARDTVAKIKQFIADRKYL